LALVLAIEPDIRQATILKRIVREQVRADLVLVDSRDAALAALTARIPDVILLTALLSPRDEEELLTYLRTLAGVQHVQTHTIPQLASTAADLESRAGGGGLFGKLLRKKEPDQKPIPGCDPDLFADQIRTFIERATERKSEAVDALQQRAAHLEFQVRPSPQAVDAAADAVASFSEPTAEPAPAGGSAWASPFEWRPASRTNVAPASPSSTLITSVPLAVVAEDQEEQARRADAEAEATRQREEEEERQRLDAAAKRKQAEEERRQREAEAKRKREEAEARRKREEEAERKRLEAAVQRKREEEERKRRLEAEAKRKRDEEERIRLEAEAKRRREEEERKRLEAEAKRRREEEERQRLEAEAKRKKEEAEAKRKREEEERRQREAEAKRKREEAEAKRKRDEEAERQRLEAEAKRRREEEERKRREEAEAKRKHEEAEAKRKRDEEAERQRLEAEARRQREEAEAKRRREEEEARLRQEEEERRRREEEEEARRREEELAAANADRFAEFRADHDEPKGVLRLMPLAIWARVEPTRANGDDPVATDDLQRLIAGLKIPTNVAVISYPRGCRIRRVRVRAQKQPAPGGEKRRPLIVSRRALRGPREDARS